MKLGLNIHCVPYEWRDLHLISDEIHRRFQGPLLGCHGVVNIIVSAVYYYQTKLKEIQFEDRIVDISNHKRPDDVEVPVV